MDATTRLLQALFSNVPGLVVDRAQFIDAQFVVALRTTAPVAPCPLCQEPSVHIHSRYQRTLLDLPWGGHPVRISLRVRKFFCPNASCPQAIFTERLPALVAPSARMTTRRADVLRAVAFALGGEAGARFAAQIGISA